MEQGHSSVKHYESTVSPSGLSLELSDREKFCLIFRILGRSFGPKFGFPCMFCALKLLPQVIIGKVNQFRETFSPKSPSRQSPAPFFPQRFTLLFQNASNTPSFIDIVARYKSNWPFHYLLKVILKKYTCLYNWTTILQDWTHQSFICHPVDMPIKDV